MGKDRAKPISVSRLLTKGKRYSNDTAKEKAFFEKARRLRKYHSQKKKVMEEWGCPEDNILNELQQEAVVGIEDDDDDSSSDDSETERIADLESEVTKQQTNSNNRPCKFYQKGICKRPNCEFAHLSESVDSPSSSSIKECKFYHARGGCKKGKKCKFLHKGVPKYGNSESSKSGDLTDIQRNSNRVKRKYLADKETQEKERAEKLLHRAKWKKKLSYKTSSGQPRLKYHMQKILSDLKKQ